MIQMSSPFLRALINNFSYHCPPESLLRSTGFSIGDLLPRVPSSDLSCLSNSTLSLLEPNSLGTHRRCVPLRTVVAYMHLTTRYAQPLHALRTGVAYMYLMTRYAPPLRAVTHRRCVHAPHDPVRTAVACGYHRPCVRAPHDPVHTAVACG